MVLLVLVLDATEDRDGLLNAGLRHHDRLEPARKGLVLLDVFAVLVERRGANGVQRAAGQRRLQDVACVHGALGCAGANDGVQLIDEQDDAAVGLLDLLEHGLQAVLELAAVLGAGHKGTHIELNDVLVADGRGHVARDDALCQAFDDGGLAYAGLADKHGVVLGAAAEHLDGAANLLNAADDRVKLALAGKICDVAAVLGEGLELRLGVLAGHALVTAQGLVGLLHALARNASGLEDAAGLGAIVRERAQQVLTRDVGVTHLGCELLGGVGHANKVCASAHLRVVARDLGRVGDGAIDLRLDRGRVGPHALHDCLDVLLARAEEGLEQVDWLHLARLPTADCSASWAVTAHLSILICITPYGPHGLRDGGICLS